MASVEQHLFYKIIVILHTVQENEFLYIYIYIWEEAARRCFELTLTL